MMHDDHNGDAPKPPVPAPRVLVELLDYLSEWDEPTNKLEARDLEKLIIESSFAELIVTDLDDDRDERDDRELVRVAPQTSDDLPLWTEARAKKGSNR